MQKTKINQTPRTKSFRGLGTNIHLTIYGISDDYILDKSNELIQKFEDQLTVNRTQSEVMAINHAAGKNAVSVSEATYKLIKKAIEVSQQNLGFNALIGPLVKLWRIGFSDAHLPKDAEIKDRLQKIDPKKVQLDDANFAVFLLEEGMELDLGGIAKGYIADRIKNLWQAYDVTSGIINLGGNLLLVGEQPLHDDHLWRVGVQNPHDVRDKAIGMVMVPECSVVTSGIYERHFEIDGQDYHHILDSKTGYPKQNNLSSVTVFTKKSIDGEIQTTNLFFAGQPLKNWGKDNPDFLGAVFVTKDNEIYLSKFKSKDFYVLSDDYQLKTLD